MIVIIITETDLFEHVLLVLKSCNKIIAFGASSSELANYLLHNEQASSCELVVINQQVDRSQEAITALAEVARAAKAVFSVGNRTFKFVNTEMQALAKLGEVQHHLLIPDLTDVVTIERGLETAQIKEERIFVPWCGPVKDELAKNCICVVNSCNSTFKKTGHNNKMTVIVQTQMDAADEDDFVSCSLRTHDHKNFRCESYSCLQNVAHAVSRSEMVIASGQFNEAGFSGLEFLMNGHITLVPDESDVAEILKSFSPALANMFLLKSANCASSEQKRKTLSDWKEKLLSVMLDRSAFEAKVEILVRDIRKHPAFTDGAALLMEAFGGLSLKLFLF